MRSGSGGLRGATGSWCWHLRLCFWNHTAGPYPISAILARRTLATPIVARAVTLTTVDSYRGTRRRLL